MYPFQNANSNYIRGFAQAVAETDDFEVIVIGAKQTKDKQMDQKLSRYNKTQYINMPIPVAKLPFRLINHFTFGKRLCEELEHFQPTDKDHIILYSDYPFTSGAILKKYAALNKAGHVYNIVVEWFQPYQYKFGKLNPDYILWNLNFQWYLPKFKKLIPISHYLANHFEKLGCRCLTIPCLSDAVTQKYAGWGKRHEKVYHFTYVGSFVRKDAIPEMVQGLTKLSLQALNKLKFHFTAVTEGNVRDECGITPEEWEKIKPHLVFHGWMEYEELLDFYSRMDYLFLAREENVMTLSNFPSKVPEMMGYGIVPVCSDAGDYTKDYLRDGYDSLVFLGCSSRSCAEAFERALNVSPDQLSIMRENARKTVENRFDYHNWKQKVQAFLND